MKKDVDKEELLLQLLKEVEQHRPWEWEGSIWKTESAYWGWLRGSLRSIWSRKWVFKNNYLKTHSFPAPVLDNNGKQKYYKTGKRRGQPVTKKHFKCELTGEVLPIKEGNIDHIAPAGSLTNGLEACIFLFRLLTSPNNMRLISKDAHAVITHMERTGMSWEEASLDKAVIAKMKCSVERQKKELAKLGFTEEEMSNKDRRKNCYIKILSKK